MSATDEDLDDFGAALAPSAAGALRAQAPRPARNGMASWTVTLAAAFMAFLASLALAATIAANRLADAWTSGLTHSATITLPPDSDEAIYGRLLDELSSDPGVLTVDPIDRSMAEAEMAAMLGDRADLAADLPLSPLIDVTFDAPAIDAAPALARRLARAGVPAHVDAHDAFASRLTEPANEVRAFALTALGVIGATAALMVALACVSALSAHAEMVDVLRLIGARDGFIAGLFERPLQINAFIGSAIGAGFAFALVVAAEAPPRDALELAPLLPELRPTVADWPSFVAVPLVFALIATLAARVAVAFALRRPEE